MSTILVLKQLLYQLKSDQIQNALTRYYVSKDEILSIQVSQKAYKCFESNVFIDDKKSVAGFGRSEEEATLNAVRIALEGVVDSAVGDDIKILKRILEGDDEKKDVVIHENEFDSGISELLQNLSLEEHIKAFHNQKIGMKEIKLMHKRDFKDIGIQENHADIIYNYFHPKCESAPSQPDGELTKLKEENEVNFYLARSCANSCVLTHHLDI